MNEKKHIRVVAIGHSDHSDLVAAMIAGQVKGRNAVEIADVQYKNEEPFQPLVKNFSTPIELTCTSLEDDIKYVKWDRITRDYYAYFWFGRLQGIHKSRHVAHKLKKLSIKKRFK